VGRVLFLEVPNLKTFNTRITILCNHCRWRIIDQSLDGEFCHAYPPGVTEGIPDRFIKGDEVHDKIEKDQMGKLILEPDEGQEGIIKKILGD